jgi:hypothetical protein
VAVGAGSVWASVYAAPAALSDPEPVIGPVVARFDAGTGQLQALIRLPHPAANAVSVNPHGVWLAAADDGRTVMRIDPASNSGRDFASIGEPSFIHSLGSDASSIWITHVETRARPGKLTLDLVRVDATTGRVTKTGIPTANVVVGDGEVWFAGYDRDLKTGTDDPGFVGQVDPSTGHILRAAHVAATELQELKLAVDAHAVWVLNLATSTLTRIAS